MQEFENKILSMDKFEGFTDEEIKNLTLPQKNDTGDRPAPPAAVYKNLQYKSRHQNRLPRKYADRIGLYKQLPKGNRNTFSSSDNCCLPKEARLYIPQIPEDDEVETEDVKDKNKNSQVLKSDKKIRPQNDKDSIIAKKECLNISSDVKKEINLNCDTSIKNDMINKADDEKSGERKKKLVQQLLNSEGTDIDALQEFDARQKLMEEQNRQRKELLKQALADRTKKTHEEVKRLNEIEGELKKLDLLLSNDVAIIRNQIESASIDFMEAQKRYDKAEKEFLDSKLDLFSKKERKELLTSHLCTIIEQNEMRKAKKLSDLMMQLEIGPKSSLITSQIKVEYKTEQKQLEPLPEHKKQNESDNRSIVKYLKTEETENSKVDENKTPKEDDNQIKS